MTEHKKIETWLDVLNLWPSDSQLAQDITKAGDIVVSDQVVIQWRYRLTHGRGMIPPAYWKRILRAAKKHGIKTLTADVFLMLAEQGNRKQE